MQHPVSQAGEPLPSGLVRLTAPQPQGALLRAFVAARHRCLGSIPWPNRSRSCAIIKRFFGWHSRGFPRAAERSARAAHLGSRDAPRGLQALRRQKPRGWEIPFDHVEVTWENRQEFFGQMRRAMRQSGARSKKATVEAALRLLADTHAQTAIRRLKGKVRWEGDLDKSRRGRVQE